MQNRSYVTQTAVSSKPSTQKIIPPVIPPNSPPKIDLTRVFNTALVSTQAGQKRDFSAELSELTESASFKAILNAVRQLSCVQGITERQAAEQVIQTFRKVDDIWSGYIFQEGLERLRNPRS